MDKNAIVILNWNGIEFLRRFLPGVVRNSSAPGTYIYIADNGSTDGSSEWVGQNFPDIRVLRFDKNHGFAGGYNLALEKIDAKYFILVNSDVEVSEGWLEPLVDLMDKNPDVAACQPKILSWSNREYFEYAGAAGGYIDRMGYPFCRGRVLSITEKDYGQYDNQTDIFWATGACMAVRSEAWKECGGFDADFFAHMEEIDLCWRFHKNGYRVVCLPASRVYHVGGGTLSYNSPRKTFLNFRNSLFMLYKNLPDKHFRTKMVSRRLLDGLAALFFLVKIDFKSAVAVWHAHMEFYGSLKALKEKRRLLRKPGEQDFSDLILNKNLVVEFFLKRHRTYKSLKTN